MFKGLENWHLILTIRQLIWINTFKWRTFIQESSNYQISYFALCNVIPVAALYYDSALSSHWLYYDSMIFTCTESHRSTHKIQCPLVA